MSDRDRSDHYRYMRQRFDDAEDRRVRTERKQENLLEQKNKLLEEARRSQEDMKYEEIAAQNQRHNDAIEEKRREREEKYNIARDQATLQAQLKKAELEYDYTKSIKVQGMKDIAERDRQYIAQNHETMLANKKAEIEQLSQLIANQQEQELRGIDFEYDTKHKYTDSKLKKREERQRFKYARTLRGDELKNDRWVKSTELDHEKWAKTKDIQNQQQLQANDLTFKLKAQQYQQEHEILIKEEERHTYRHNAEVDTQQHAIRTQNETQAYLIKLAADTESEIIKMQEADKSYDFRAQVDSRLYREKLEAETAKHYYVEKINTQEMRERAEVDKDKSHHLAIDEVFKALVNGEIKKQLMTLDAQLKVWVFQRTGSQLQGEDLESYIKENIDEWVNE